MPSPRGLATSRAMAAAAAVKPAPAAALPPPSAARPLHLAAFDPRTLAALAPAAAGVPAALWSRALGAPVADMLDRPGKGFRGRLTRLAWRLAGRDDEPPPALGALLETLHAGSMVIDDIEDGSCERRGQPALHHRHGLPLALNAGNWMYFWPLELLGQLALPAVLELQLRRRINRVLTDCHYGQALDLAARVGELPPHSLAAVVHTVSTLKTGRLMALAAELGATAAGADPALITLCAEFGEALGVGLQMLDDLGNLSGRTSPAKRFEDLRHARVTWPWAWAAACLEQGRFTALASEVEALSHAAAQAGETSPPAADRRSEALAAILRTSVTGHGRRQIHWHLTTALGQLRALPGRRSVIEALEAEIARLEASYG